MRIKRRDLESTLLKETHNLQVETSTKFEPRLLDDPNKWADEQRYCSYQGAYNAGVAEIEKEHTPNTPGWIFAISRLIVAQITITILKEDEDKEATHWARRKALDGTATFQKE